MCPQHGATVFIGRLYQKYVSVHATHSGEMPPPSERLAENHCIDACARKQVTAVTTAIHCTSWRNVNRRGVLAL